MCQHPATEAWTRLHPNGVEPSQNDLIKKKNRSFVCRLVAVGPDNSDIIAKRREREKAIVECTIYEEILPQIGIDNGIHFFGFIEEPECSNDGKFAWLFFEDCGDKRCWRGG